MNEFNTEPLALALHQLEQGLEEASRHPQHELMRDGVIQRFEYTVDLAWKIMLRYLKFIQVEETAIRSKNDIFREAAKVQLIDNPESWMRYYAARNETSHDYHRSKAQQVYQQAELFLPDAQKLLKALNDAS